MISSMIRCGCCIFWQLLFKARIIHNPIPKCNTRIWKMSFEILNTTITNAYLLAQIQVWHVWFKWSTPIFIPKWRYYMLNPKNPMHSLWHVGIAILTTFHSLVSLVYLHPFKCKYHYDCFKNQLHNESMPNVVNNKYRKKGVVGKHKGMQYWVLAYYT
jgi:hypothetical protein